MDNKPNPQNGTSTGNSDFPNSASSAAATGDASTDTQPVVPTELNQPHTSSDLSGTAVGADTLPLADEAIPTIDATSLPVSSTPAPAQVIDPTPVTPVVDQGTPLADPVAAPTIDMPVAAPVPTPSVATSADPAPAVTAPPAPPVSTQNSPVHIAAPEGPTTAEEPVLSKKRSTFMSIMLALIVLALLGLGGYIIWSQFLVTEDPTSIQETEEESDNSEALPEDTGTPQDPTSNSGNQNNNSGATDPIVSKIEYRYTHEGVNYLLTLDNPEGLTTSMGSGTMTGAMFVNLNNDLMLTVRYVPESVSGGLTDNTNSPIFAPVVVTSDISRIFYGGYIYREVNNDCLAGSTCYFHYFTNLYGPIAADISPKAGTEMYMKGGISPQVLSVADALIASHKITVE